MKTEIISIIPVLHSSNIERDIAWYKEKMGFETYFADRMYAVLYREKVILNLQRYANTADNPLLDGSVIRTNVKNIQPMFEELVVRGTGAEGKFRKNTALKKMKLDSMT